MEDVEEHCEMIFLRVGFSMLSPKELFLIIQYFQEKREE